MKNVKGEEDKGQGRTGEGLLLEVQLASENKGKLHDRQGKQERGGRGWAPARGGKEPSQSESERNEGRKRGRWGGKRKQLQQTDPQR